MITEIQFLSEEPRSSYYSRNPKSFERLEVWKKAHDFVLAVYELTNKFPVEEKFGLTNQFRRAAVSIAANIAEGTGKKSIKDIIRFLMIARGSLEECQYFLILSKDLGYITLDVQHSEREKLNATGRLLNGLINSLEKKLL